MDMQLNHFYFRARFQFVGYSFCLYNTSESDVCFSRIIRRPNYFIVQKGRIKVADVWLNVNTEKNNCKLNATAFVHEIAGSWIILYLQAVRYRPITDENKRVIDPYEIIDFRGRPLLYHQMSV
jgi:hypothetical protein